MQTWHVGLFTTGQVTGSLALFALLTLTACGPAKKQAPTEKLISSDAYSTITATSNILADGQTASVVTILLKDQKNGAVVGLQPVLEVSGTGNTVGTCSASDATGASTCQVTSTRAETKTISLRIPVAISTTAVFVAGPAAKLGFAVQPSGGTAGDAWVEPPVVEVQDAFGNRIADSTASITLALQSGTGVLSGTLVRAAAAGQALFSGLSLDLAGTDKVLRATSPGLTAGDSAVFSIVAASGHNLVFATQPGGGAAGEAWAAQPVVHIQNGGVTDGTRSDAVTLTLTSGTGTVTGTRTVAAVAGVATFTGLSMTAVGAKALTASSPGSTLIVSNNFNIGPAAPASLQFNTQPGGGGAGTVWPQQPIVAIFDAFGNLVTTSSASVVLSVNSGTGSLLGTTTQAASSGVATFSGLKMNISGTKRLRATLGSLNIDSTSFVVGSGAATKLAYVTQPGGGVAGVAWTNQPAVEALDAFDNRDTSFVGTIGLSLSAGTGAVTGGTLALAATAGIAQFTGLKTNLAGADKKLTASATGLTSVQSGTFAVVHAPAHHLSFTAIPATTGVANTALTPQPALRILDQFDNPVLTGADALAPVAATLVSGDGQLAGTGTAVAQNGSLAFSGLKFTTKGTKRIRFTKANTAGMGGTGALFIETASLQSVVGPAAQLAFRTQPGGGTAGIVWLQQPVVEVQDAAGNLVDDATNSIGINVASGTMGFLLGTTSTTASGGVASFANLKLNPSGPKSLVVTSAGLTAGTSSTFNVTHNIATELFVMTQAGTAAYGQNWNPASVVHVRDAYENIVETGPDAVASITASLETGTGALNGTKVLTASSGIVSFGSLNASLIGAKTIRYSKEDLSTSDGAGVLSVLSGTINISHGPATKLAIRTQPVGAAAGALFATMPVIEILDAGNNLVLNAANSVTAANLSAPTGSVLGGTKVLAASGGVATFTDLTLTKAGASMLRFTSGALTRVDSTSLTTTHGLATKIGVVTEPGSAIAAISFGTQPVIEILDAYDNRVTTGVDASANVTASLVTGSGTLSGALTSAAVAGLVNYAGLSINSVGSKNLRFTKQDLSGSGGAATLTKDSTSFTVSPGPAASLSFSEQPGGGSAGAVWAQPADVVILDTNGFMVTTATNPVTVSLSAGSGVLSGTLTVNAVAGVAEFPDLTIDLVGSGKALSATSPGLLGALSNPFTITTAATDPASTVVASLSTLPGNNVATSTVTVTLKDAFGNVAANRAVTMVSDRGASDTITGSPGTTDVSGVVTFTVKSNTAGAPVFTVTEGAVEMTTKPVITFTDAQMSVAQSSWSQDRITLRRNNSDILTFGVVIKNAAGDALQDKTVVLASNRGGLDTIAGGSITDASGVATFTIKTSTAGRAVLTASVDGVILTDKVEMLALDILPIADLQAAFARNDGGLKPGTNALSTSLWRESSGSGDDLSLTGFAFSGSSGWLGDGGTTVTSDGSGPHRVGFDGSDDRASFGTVLNAYGDLSAELWARTSAATQSGRVIFASADATPKGLVLRHASDGSQRLEAFVGVRNTYADEVKADSPTLYLRLGDTAGTTAAAAVGVAGTYSGSGVTMGADGALSNSNETSVLFDGVAGSVSLGTSLGGDADTSISLEAWIYLTNDVVSGSRSIITKENSTGYSLEIAAGNLLQMRAYSQANIIAADTMTTATGVTALTTGTWYHVVGIRDVDKNCSNLNGASIRIYLNGTLEGCEVLDTYSIHGNSAEMKIGAHSQTAGQFFPGRIDEVAVYVGSVLTTAQMNAHRVAQSLATCYSSSSIPANTWFHAVVGHASSSALSLAVNGTEVCNESSSDASGNSGAHMGLGAGLDAAGAVRGGTAWSGAIGEFRFYNHRVTAAEAGSLWNATKSKYP